MKSLVAFTKMETDDSTHNLKH